jgi:hypothetical protein
MVASVTGGGTRSAVAQTDRRCPEIRPCPASEILRSSAGAT